MAETLPETPPETMRALTLLNEGFSATASGPEIEAMEPWLAAAEVPVPTPGAGQVLIKVDLAAVNPSDLHFIKGEYGVPRVKGNPAGFEGTGTIVAGESPFLGQRVSYFATASGTWAEYALTDATAVVPLRPDLKEADAAGLLVNPVTAAAMVALARETGTEALILTAAGSQLGKFAIVLAAAEGMAPIAVVRRAAQAEALRALGAAEVLVTTEPDFEARAAEVLRAHKPRVMLDAVADQASEVLFARMPNRARWVIYGKLSTEAPSLTAPGQFIFMGKRIEGFWLTEWMGARPQAEVAAAVMAVQERFATGVWTTDVAEIVTLDDAMTRLPEALKIPDGKVFIRP